MLDEPLKSSDCISLVSVVQILPLDSLQSSLEHLKTEECGCSSGAGEVQIVDCKSKTEKILSHLSPPFDIDVGDILCLSPRSQGSQKEGNEQLKPDLIAVEDDKGYLSTPDRYYAKEKCHAAILLESRRRYNNNNNNNNKEKKEHNRCEGLNAFTPMNNNKVITDMDQMRSVPVLNGLINVN